MTPTMMIIGMKTGERLRFPVRSDVEPRKFITDVTDGMKTGVNAYYRDDSFFFDCSQIAFIAKESDVVAKDDK